jgi:hypothetical protein
MDIPGATAPPIQAPFRPAVKRRRRARHSLASLTALAVVGILFFFFDQGDSTSGPVATGNPAATTTDHRPAPAAGAAAPMAANAERIRQAFEGRQSGFFVSCEGTVTRILPDDNDGSRHQCFLIRLANGVTLKIAHNIDLAEKAPVAVGDRVTFRGEYQWNNQGGVIHWTHHDPSRRRSGGWLELHGRRYQ